MTWSATCSLLTAASPTPLVADAISRGATGEAVALRRDWLTRFPSSTSFSRLATTAAEAGV